MWRHLQELSSQRNKWLLIIFVLYVALVFVFATVYNLIYLRHRRAFAFNADILRTQSSMVESESQQQLGRLAIELSALRDLEKVLSLSQDEPKIGLEFGGLLLTSTIKGTDATYTVIWAKARGGFPGVGEPPPTNLRVSPSSGSREFKIVGDPYYRFPETLSDFRSLCHQWITDWESRIQDSRSVLVSLSTDTPEVWSYWDFVYFSMVTQSTVGFGDILPNSTIVRLIVSLQLLIAVALLGVLINVVIARPY